MSNIHTSGTHFEVVCKRCGHKFTVIRNWGGGIRLASNENVNPAHCPNCQSHQLEVW